MRYPYAGLKRLLASLPLLLGGAAQADVALNHICDPVDPKACLLPFPNNWFTTGDSSTATGRRVNLSNNAMPRSVGLFPIGASEWNRNDGFSPGTPIITHVPGLDLAQTGAAPITDIGRSLASDAPIVLLNTLTGERWPYWAELDARASPDRRVLIIRPAKNLQEGVRYLVLLRNLRDATGNVLTPNSTVADLLDGEPWWSLNKERSDVLRRHVNELTQRGVSTSGLYMAWDFTVASQRNLSERILHMRDEAFAQLGSAAPAFVVTAVTDHTPEADARIARRVEGYVEVPSYLNQQGGPPGSSMNYGSDRLPEQLPGNIQRAQFVCNIPRVAFQQPAWPGLYGHGLLGSAEEVNAGNVKDLSAEHGFAFCASPWIGMAEEDIPNVVTVFGDFTRFNTLPDRLQQSLLNFMFIGRAMIHPGGFVSHAAFQRPDGAPLLDTSKPLAYDGNSQGGIVGGALVAVSQDIRRGVLGVTGMNYSTLLNRSVDFNTYQIAMDITYSDKLDQQIIFGLLQMLWDRAETNGYAQHLTDSPLPGTPAHRVLMHVAYGDHQVAPVTAEVQARTIGARIYQPAVAPGRNPDLVPYWNIPGLTGSPYAGSALVIWDSGTPNPPLTNLPPDGSAYGADPHGHPRRMPNARVQKAHFLKTGEVIDVCGGAPCVAQ